MRGNCDQAPFSLACAIRTPAAFMMDLIMEPDRAIQLIEYTSRMSVQLIRLMAEAGVDMVSNGDSPAGPGMISPAMYEAFALPYEQKMIEEARKFRTYYLLHICGKIYSGNPG